MADITYCYNIKCPFKECDRHLNNLSDKTKPVSLAAFDATCRDYMDYLIDLLDKREEQEREQKRNI